MNDPTIDTPTLSEIHRTLARLEQQIGKVTDDHERRLRAVERWVYAVPPTLVLAGASIIGAIFKG